MTATTKRRATAQEYLSTWAKARRDIDLLLENAVETQQQLHRLIGITDALYEGVLGEEAPEDWREVTSNAS